MTVQQMNEIAASAGFDLDFQFFDVVDREVEDVDSAGNYTKEVVYFTEYQGFADGLEYGIFARISNSPQKLPHEFYVVFASDAQDTNGTPYETLENALRYMNYLLEQVKLQ